MRSTAPRDEKRSPVRAAPAAVTLRRNILVFGIGGLILPFPFIKLIDLVVSALGLA